MPTTHFPLSHVGAYSCKAALLLRYTRYVVANLSIYEIVDSGSDLLC